MKYNAFISYSHRDEKFASLLHQSLEKFRLPSKSVQAKDLIKKQKNSLYPIFRDRDELPTSSDLSTMINDALDNSRYLILLCSPRSAQSRWVEAEIIRFIEQGKVDKIVPLLVEQVAGTESIPKVLKHAIESKQTIRLIDARDKKGGMTGITRQVVSILSAINIQQLKQAAIKRRFLMTTFSIVLGFVLLIWGAFYTFDTAIENANTITQEHFNNIAFPVDK